MPVHVSAVGYVLASIAFLTLTVLLVTSWQGRFKGAALAIAAACSTLWGLTLALGFSDPSLAVAKVFLAETLRNGSWLLFLSALFVGAVGGGPGHRLFVYGGPGLAVVVLVTGIGLFLAERAGMASPRIGEALIFGSFSLSLIALIMLEQIYRNARASQRESFKFIGLGLVALFAYDLVLYSHWILFRQIDPLFWSARGFVATLCVPLIAVSAQRNPDWAVGIFVSRQVVFYTTTLMGVGIYLVAISGVGYYIRLAGGGWGPTAQVVFFVAATLSLALMLFSNQLRSRLRVFLTKHFFRNRYDYREEWLRLMNTLASPQDEGMPLGKRSVQALADIVGANEGVLYLRDQDKGAFRCDTGWNTGACGKLLTANAPLAQFLEGTGWIVDVEQYRLQPELYEPALGERMLDSDLQVLGLENPKFVVPLVNEKQLLGFVALTKHAASRSLNFEDHDLLKTVGQQIAGYLDQERKKFQLAESRQFETFNRLTAFLMHDLKNIIAQQSMVVENAQKHKGNPEFVEDAIETVKSGVTRMRKLLEQLPQGTPVPTTNKVELGKLVLEAASQCADRCPEPGTDVGQVRLWVRADRDRLLMALVHAIRNAQDATATDGSITVSVEPAGDACLIRVRDTGRGMEQAFIEQRLFKPFDSTKGPQGMGIGAYQIRETVHGMGGQIHVESGRGTGTCLTLSLPAEGVVQGERVGGNR
jgi:putative PEP-CTERM system histidine kinase